jgi:sugar phosphate isomerase/epimerase
MLIGGRAHSLDEAARVGEAGFDFAEINLLHPHQTFQEIPSLLRIKEQHKFFYLVHGPEEGSPFDCARLRTSLLPQIKTLVAFASELEARLITAHFWLDGRYIQPPVLREKLAILEEMLILAREKRIPFCLENLSERACDFEPAFGRFPDLGITLDIGHGELLSPANTAHNFIQEFPDRIRHVHIHDNRGGNSPADDLHLPLGEGSITFEPILSALCKAGYNRTITLEVPPRLFVQQREKLLTMLSRAQNGAHHWLEQLYAAKSSRKGDALKKINFVY